MHNHTSITAHASENVMSRTTGLKNVKFAPHAKRMALALGWRLRATVTPNLALEQRVKNKTILITGASSGIGAQSARRLAAAGARVVVTARSLDKLNDLVQDINAHGGEAIALRCDISDLDDCDRLSNQLIAQAIHIDILINNAGRSIRRSAVNSTDRFHDYQRTMQLNYFGAIRIALNLIPSMIRQGGGHIINISTLGVQTGVPRFSAYLGSKFALEGWTMAVQNELSHHGIDFSIINYPLVRTPMIAPTKAYDHAPALSQEAAVAWMCDAIIRRPKRLVSASGVVAQALYQLLPKTTEMAVNIAYQLVPETFAKITVLDDERRARQRIPGKQT
jgi:short-subunit dehydrogenase